MPEEEIATITGPILSLDVPPQMLSGAFRDLTMQYTKRLLPMNRAAEVTRWQVVHVLGVFPKGPEPRPETMGAEARRTHGWQLATATASPTPLRADARWRRQWP